MFNLRRLLAILILLAVLALVIIVWRHLQQQDPLEILEALPEEVDLSLKELHYTQNEDGRRSWTLDAEKAEYLRDSGRAELDVVKLVMYDTGSFGEVSLTAEQGELAQEQRQVEVWGQVVVTTGAGERLYTERLLYDGATRKVYAPQQVQMYGTRIELKGADMQLDLESGKLLLKKDVWMLLLPEERKSLDDE